MAGTQFYLAALAAALSTTAAMAQPAPDDNRITLGIGGGIAPEYEGASEYRFQPGGLIQGRVSGFDFAVRGPNIYLDLIRDAPDSRINVIAGPVAQLRLDRTGKISDPRVRLFGKRDVALELGGYAGIGIKGVLIPPATLTFDVSAVHDVTGEHGSYLIKPGASLSSPVSKRTFANLGVSAEYVGKGYGRTYYDVPAIAAPVPTLLGYSTRGSGFKSIGTSLVLTHDLTGDVRKGWSLFSLAAYSRLLGQYKRSPIVADAGDADQFLAVVGVAFSF